MLAKKMAVLMLGLFLSGLVAVKAAPSWEEAPEITTMVREAEMPSGCIILPPERPWQPHNYMEVLTLGGVAFDNDRMLPVAFVAMRYGDSTRYFLLIANNSYLMTSIDRYEDRIRGTTILRYQDSEGNTLSIFIQRFGGYRNVGVAGEFREYTIVFEPDRRTIERLTNLEQEIQVPIEDIERRAVKIYASE